MDISKLLDLLGKEHTTVANRLLSSIHELRRRDDSSIVLNTQNFSQSLTSMSSDMSILRDTPTNPVEVSFLLADLSGRVARFIGVTLQTS